MTKVSKPRTRRDPYDPGVTRVISIRVHPDTLRKLRFMAADADKTVCSLLGEQAEYLAASGRGAH
jgi:hypothetical protein